MRKLVPIGLIILLLFNVLGYYGVFVGLRYQHRQELIERFDAGRYDEAQTVTLQLPLAVPYAGDGEYTRIDGEFEHQGEFYHTVKQRLYHDTLFIVCVKDLQSKRIDQALTAYVKTFADNHAGQQQGKLIPVFLKEYLIGSCSIDRSSTGWAQPIHRQGTMAIFIPSFQPDVIHPPERA